MTILFYTVCATVLVKPVGVLQRYYGWYANRTRGIRRRAGAHEQPLAVETEPVPPSIQEARRR